MKFWQNSKIVLTILISISLLAPTSGFAVQTETPSYGAPFGNESEQTFYIDKDGNISIRQAKIYQVAGTTFYARYYIGLAFIRITVKTDADTRVRRRFGDEISLKEINVGDTVNVEGKIEGGADTISIIARSITNFSNQKAIAGFSGTIVGLGSSADSFIIKTKTGETINLLISTTTQIRKGNRILRPDQIKNGDVVADTAGTYDHATKNLDSKIIAIYIDPKTFAKRNFQGSLKTLTSGNPPTFNIVIDNKEYAVQLSPNALILNNLKKKIGIERFLVGDTVRLYGNIRESEELIIDAEIVRNLNL